MTTMMMTPPRLLSLVCLLLAMTTVASSSTTCATSSSSSSSSSSSFFNFEVERRIQDQLVDFLAPPEEINSFIATLSRTKKGFASGSLLPSDRELYLKLITSFPSNLIYVYMEDGSGMGYDNGFDFAFYREPGNSGYSVEDESMRLHLESCVNATDGTPVPCDLEAGRQYIQYYECDDDTDADDCDLYEPCPDDVSQTLQCDTMQGLAMANMTKAECHSQKKWCRKYTIQTAQALQPNSTYTGRGYLPDNYLCMNARSEVTQTVGDALSIDGSGTPGKTCVFEDGVTPVHRVLQGNYAYCGGGECNDTFTGAFYSPEYDGRYRPWYLNAKERQRPHWSDPYLYETGYIGMTHMHPVYDIDIETQRNVFMGVMAVDYKVEDFATFLEDNYKDSGTMVAIVEDAEPHYLIGMSTGTLASIQYLADDPTQLCPTSVQYGSKNCVSERRTIDQIGEFSLQDMAIKQAFLKQKEAGFPQELLFVKIADDVGADSFVSQATIFEPNGGLSNLKWRIVTVSPASEETQDTIMPGDPFFAVVLIVGMVGLGACLFLFGYLFQKRNVRAIAYGDWRFTCAFVVACGLLNTSTFTLVGPNTDATCVTRMWFFHWFFTAALAPLFIKCWRMYMLTRPTYQRTTISNMQAAWYTLPFIGLQTTILLVFTFVDPPQATEVISTDEGFTRSIVCQTQTPALFITQLVLEAGLVVAGCALAYLQRNMDEKFGESKQMLVAMYNIALVGVVILVVMNTADMYGSGAKLLLSIGILWGSVISAAAFVLPRMVQIHRGEGLRKHSVRVSGAAYSTEFQNSQELSQRFSQTGKPSRSSLGAISESESTTSNNIVSAVPEQSQEFAAQTSSESP